MTSLPAAAIVLIYAVAAVGPAVLLMRYVYKLDAVEKEPASLLWKLILGGLLAAVCAFILEEVFDAVGDAIVPSSNADADLQYALLDALFVGVIEESCKFFFLKKFSWKSDSFNCRYDGLVYAVFVSLGFAAVENVLYVCFYGGLSVALTRALLSIPAHMTFGAYMGIYYGRAKVCRDRGDENGASWNLCAGLGAAIFFHAVYDGCLMANTSFAVVLFICIVIFMYGYVFKRIKIEAETDEYTD